MSIFVRRSSPCTLISFSFRTFMEMFSISRTDESTCEPIASCLVLRIYKDGKSLDCRSAYVHRALECLAVLMPNWILPEIRLSSQRLLSTILKNSKNSVQSWVFLIINFCLCLSLAVFVVILTAPLERMCILQFFVASFNTELIILPSQFCDYFYFSNPKFPYVLPTVFQVQFKSIRKKHQLDIQLEHSRSTNVEIVTVSFWFLNFKLRVPYQTFLFAWPGSNSESGLKNPRESPETYFFGQVRQYWSSILQYCKLSCWMVSIEAVFCLTSESFPQKKPFNSHAVTLN